MGSMEMRVKLMVGTPIKNDEEKLGKLTR